ncbi:hypothetical protein GJ689_17075 [Rhodoplanes serenus]|jgi:hypothetical protein|uniref:Uncharacterized protein n=1 Tax=Rhodoplanes serenus TaxID=200615 RepID=A0A447CRP7_9BRAD|nr:hypothetical protein [Rhodoplanes serenus]MBI5110816.1 hypothetical protein [Rhodovulum sp.]MTW17922.1 hypothetical protein [Rhodoplanes serenus]VCU07838.1 hypothetical protein RHODGE_RHODGE_00903 [Rhodoplanes serenus]
MAFGFVSIPLDEARAGLDLDAHFADRTTLDDIVVAAPRPSLLVVRYSGNHAVSAGDLDMDGLVTASVAGVVVDGDLELFGAILNRRAEAQPAFLWVRGSLHCRALVLRRMDVVVDRNLTAGLVVANGEDCHLAIGGDVHADRMIVDDGAVASVGGRVAAKGWNGSAAARVALRRSRWADEVRPELRKAFLGPDGALACTGGSLELVQALLDGRDILRPEP